MKKRAFILLLLLWLLIVFPTGCINSSGIFPISNSTSISETVVTQPPVPQPVVHSIVYLGGSITAGANASKDESSWAGLVGNWLKIQNQFNAGSPATSSWYGLIRLQKQVIEKRPDLVFIDFAANDDISFEGELQDGFAPAAEALIRRLRTELPDTKLMILILSRPDSQLSKPRLASKNMWIALAQHYDIPYERLDNEIFNDRGSNTLTNSQIDIYFNPPTSLHPNNKGHALIAQMIERDFGKLQSEWSKPIQDYTYYMPYSKAYEAKPIIRSGEDHDGINGEWKAQNGSIESNLPGSSVTWSGDISSFGVETNFGKGAGVMEWSIDGRPFVKIDLSKTYTPIQQIWNLPKGLHTITVQVVRGKVDIHNFFGV